ncbi:MAG: DNA polymerase III subunit epsilon [Alphaproteobacteria bacterium]
MREVVLDTETTGLNPMLGDRIVEIGCIELINHVRTDSHFHCFVNPERPMPAEAAAVHGLTDDFLARQPCFADVVDDLLDFIKDSPLVIHNAGFDIGFLNAEFARLRLPALVMSRAVDTLGLARQKYPGAQASLDALCRRFGVDNSARTKHGALLDAELLADVYLELVGGRQPEMALSPEISVTVAVEQAPRPIRPPRPHAASPQELARHAAMIELLINPVWRSFTRA